MGKRWGTRNKEGKMEERRGDIIREYGSRRSSLILQINNCTSVKHKMDSFSWCLVERFAHGDAYLGRRQSFYENLADVNTRDEVGSVKIFHCANNTEASIACLYAQYKMGRADSSYYIDCSMTDEEYNITAKEKDSAENRLDYFRQSLSTLAEFMRGAEMRHIKEIVMPKYIGCGGGGGNWEQYRNEIACFAEGMAEEKIKVLVIEYSDVEAILNENKKNPLWGQNRKKEVEVEKGWRTKQKRSRENTLSTNKRRKINTVVERLTM